MKTLSYNFKGVLNAPAKALSAKKILVLTFYLLAGLALYDIFTYIALVIDGDKINKIFKVYGFFPFYKYVYHNIFAELIFVIGSFISILTVMLGMTSVAKIELESLSGDRFYPVLKALFYPFKKIKQLILAEAGIIFFLGAVLLLFIIFGLISRIPFLGDWLYAIFFVIPNFFVSIFMVLIVFVLCVSIILMPAVIVYDKKEEAFQAILETFSTIIRRPIHWLSYTLYSVVTGKLFAFVYAYFCYRAIEFTTMAASIGGGENIKNLTKQAVSLMPLNSDIVKGFCNLFPGIDFGFSLLPFISRGSAQPAAYLLAFMIFLIFSTVIAYFLSVIATTQMRAYLIIRHLKDEQETNEEVEH